MRLPVMSDEVAAAMKISMNGESPAAVQGMVAAGHLALLSCDGCYALVSESPGVACIEAVEGAGGTQLAARVVNAARAAGMQCEAWVFNKARARLAERAGMRLTGETRIGANGRQQMRVRT